jgi:regulator of protease activity HflC (stomatin/prohibitin superfamily)
VPWLALRWWRNRRDPLCLFAAGLALLVIWGGLSGQWSYGRLISHLVLLLQAGLADALVALEERLAVRRRWAAARHALAPAVAVALIAASWPVVRSVIDESAPGDRRWLSFLETHVGREDVVLTDVDTCWYVPAFQGKVVAYPMKLPFVPDHAERLAAVERFFEPDAEGAEQTAILARYGVRYVLLPKHHFDDWRERVDAMSRLGVTVYSNAEYELVRVATGAPIAGDRPVPDDVTFKTKDGNNVYIDVNVMWRIDPQKAPFLVSHVGQSIQEINERVVRPIARSVIRDVFNEITSEEYYQVAVKNRVAGKAKEALASQLGAYGLMVDMLQVQQHRFDQEYQAAINAQKQAEADVQTLVEQQKNMEVQKKSELEGKRAQWNRQLEDAGGEAGRIRNEADGYFQTRTNEAKAMVAVAQAEAEGVRKEAQALSKLGGAAYVKMQVAQQLSHKRVTIVPGSNVSTMDVNRLVDYLVATKNKEAGKEE